MARRPLILLGLTALAFNLPVGHVGASEQARTRHESIDGLFARIAEQVPEFAGMYLDDRAKVLNVAVKGGDSRAGTRAARLLQRELRRQEGHLGRPRIVDADYSFLELRRWYAAVRADALPAAGVVSSDIDERLNRLDFGVSTADGEAVVRRAQVRLGIPAGAVVTHAEQPARKLSSLRTRHRPLVGGLQIEHAGSLCTLGLPVSRAGVAGFVTNSHCSSVEAGPDTTVQHQATASGTTNRVGVEAADPPYFSGTTDCPWTGWKCRYSDASFVRKDDAVSYSRGKIARTVVGSYFWPNSADLYTVTVEADYGVVGRTVYKVGRTTGRTQGSIQDTCVDYDFPSLKVSLLCQEKTNLKSLGGDSGSAVFRITGGTSVTLYGIMWGGPDDTETYYSSWGWGVEDASTELGSMCARVTC